MCRREAEENSDCGQAGKELLLNESMAEHQGNYRPTQFENSLGKLQVCNS